MRTIKADFSQMKSLADNFKILSNQKNSNVFLEKEIKVLGAQLMKRCIEHTPVGEYSNEVGFIAYKGTDKEKKVDFKTSTGKIGGRLKGNWRATPAKKITGGKTIEVFNDLFYAGYVNDGHRIIRNGVQTGFYDGQHFMETANMEFTDSLETTISNDLEDYIKVGINGKN